MKEVYEPGANYRGERKDLAMGCVKGERTVSTDAPRGWGIVKLDVWGK